MRPNRIKSFHVTAASYAVPRCPASISTSSLVANAVTYSERVSATGSGMVD